MDLKRQVLLYIGIIALLKSVWGLVLPRSLSRVVEWWLAVAARMRTLLGCLYAVLALCLFALILIHEPLSNWILGMLALLLGAASVLYFRFNGLEQATRTLVLRRNTWTLRALSLMGLVIAIVMIWTAATGR